MAKLSSFVPAPQARSFDPDKPNPNLVVLQNPGRARLARLTKISNTFYDRNTGTKEKPKYETCKKDAPGAIPEVRVYVTFDKPKNKDGQPLVLSTKMRASLHEKANFAKLISAVTGIPVAQVEKADVDTNDLVETPDHPGRPVLVTCKAGYNDFAIIDKILPTIEEDDEDDSEVAAAHEPSNDVPEYEEFEDDEESMPRAYFG